MRIVAFSLLVALVGNGYRPPVETATATIIIELHEDDPPEEAEIVKETQVDLINLPAFVHSVLQQQAISESKLIRSIDDPNSWLLENLRIDSTLDKRIEISLSTSRLVDDASLIVNALTQLAIEEYASDHREQNAADLQAARSRYREIKELTDSLPGAFPVLRLSLENELRDIDLVIAEFET